jgi:guanylate kinase
MKKIVIIGKSCSGKTEFANALRLKGLRIGVANTSRPMRESETNGSSYHFCTKEDFKKLIKEDELAEHDKFNNWFYGLTKDEYEKSHVLIQTPKGLLKLIDSVGRDNLIVIFTDTESSIRMKRAISRGDDPNEVERRYKTDEKDFRKFEKLQDWDLRLDYRLADKFNFFIDLFSRN